MNHSEAPLEISPAEYGLRGPRHRWETAEGLPPGRFDRLVQRSDELVQASHHFRQMVKHGATGVERAGATYPEVAAAVALEEDPEKLEKLKVTVLGQLPPVEVARRPDVDEAVLKTWKALFYDIDVKNGRNAIGWIAAHVIEPELDAGRSELAAKLKLVASTGSVGARAVLDVGLRAPVTAGEHLFQRRLRLHLKCDQALTMTEGPQYDFRFVRLHLNLKMQEHRLRVAEAKLAERCGAALRKHELAKIRLEADLERAKCRAAREARKAEEVTLIQEGERHARELIEVRLRRFELAEQQEAAARAAASPLARLRWSRGQQSQICPLPCPEPTPDTWINEPAEMRTCLTSGQGNNPAAHVQMTVVTI